jgi:hypothetical protein
MLEVVRRIEALSAKSEFAIVTQGAFGYFSFISVYLAFNASPLPPISQQSLHGLMVFESIVLFLLALFLHLRGWTWRRVGGAPSIKYTSGKRLGASKNGGASLLIWSSSHPKHAGTASSLQTSQMLH